MLYNTTVPISFLFRWNLYIVTSLSILVFAVACGKDSPTKPLAVPEPERITITPSSVALSSIGQTAKLTATVYSNDNVEISGAALTWSSGSPGVATVDSEGLVTAIGNGTAQITARAGSASQSIQVTVMQEAGRIDIEPDVATLMSLGETVQLTASVVDQNGQQVVGAVVTWSSGDEEVATVDNAGLVTAVSNGTAQITARAGSASQSIQVTVMQEAGRIDIEPDVATLMSLGETVQLTASVVDQNGQQVVGAVVTWSSGNEEVATVDNAGLVTAVSNGTAQITARAGSASQSIQVTVMQEAGRIDIEPDMATLMSLGETVQLTASVVDQNGQQVVGVVVTWSSGNEEVATVDNAGLVTAVSNGTAQITARAGSASQSIQVTVMQEAGRIDIEPDMATLFRLGFINNRRHTAQLSVVVYDGNGHEVENAEVTWSSDDESVATVDNAGLVTAESNSGTAQITARSGSVSASVTVRVLLPVLLKSSLPLDLCCGDPILRLDTEGQTAQLSAIVYDVNGQEVEGAELSWSSSDEFVATVDAEGLVTAFTNGEASISALVIDDPVLSSNSGRIRVIVDIVRSGEIVIKPPFPHLDIDHTVRFTATEFDDNGQEVTGAEFSWSSDDGAVATVDEYGIGNSGVIRHSTDYCAD